MYPSVKSEKHFVRRAVKQDYDALMQFISSEFSKGWQENVEKGFHFSQIPIFIAFDENSRIVGFEAYDVVREKKGLFGPMGTLLLMEAI